MLRSSVLPDGRYDAFIVDITVRGTAATLELTIVAGAHKGEIVTITSEGLTTDEIELLGMPATLFVENGVPRVTIDE